MADDHEGLTASGTTFYPSSVLTQPVATKGAGFPEQGKRRASASGPGYRPLVPRDSRPGPARNAKRLRGIGTCAPLVQALKLALGTQ